jgi:hypothetical protein
MSKNAAGLLSLGFLAVVLLTSCSAYQRATEAKSEADAAAIAARVDEEMAIVNGRLDGLETENQTLKNRLNEIY